MFGFRLSGGKGILQRSQVALVVTESTGGLEIPAAKAIRRAGIAVIIANPRQTH
ncbi:IS110 family transposase, partial [Neisseria meningitidis]|nr:IS110 family transposase [Neisseria meningitidis]MBW3915075.1 IS110 family transposase [Neisseria meningitidis]MBW3917133.1 IS110 family transposase [Neisseria meningitidis]MBW3921216.1 IS110 family transposase [Neisseria meningitidis]MBW3923007.1 IS110 family transposase [Neisseria meningitidis]